MNAEKEKKVLEKLNQWWEYTCDHPTWKEAKDLHIKCFQYKEGDQWTAEEKKLLAERGQPDTVNNKVAVTINKLMGDFVDRKYSIGWRGRNMATDEDVSALLTDIFRYIRTSNNVQFEETDMADDGFTCGFGVMEVFVEFDDLNQPEIRVRQEDALVVYPDPDWRRYDWNEDARFIFRRRWLDAETVKEQWPDAKLRIDELSTWDGASSGGGIANTVDLFLNEHYVDSKKKKIAVIDCEYKEPVSEEICLIDDPSGALPVSVRSDAPNYKELIDNAEGQGLKVEKITRVRKKIIRCVFIGGKILEYKELRQKYYSLIPYVMYRKKNGVPYSLIALGLSLQDAINKRESKAIHLLNTNQTVAEKTAYLDKEEFQKEIHKPDGLVEVADGALANGRIQLRNNIEMANSQFSMHQQAQNDFSQVVGVSPGAAIDTGELRGSAALGRKFSEMGKPVARLFENLSRTRTILGKVLLDFVQLYTTSQKVMMITDDENKERLLQLSNTQVNKIKTAQYDAVIDDFIDNKTLQQEQWALFMQALPQVLPFGPYWIKKLLELSELRDKKKIIEELDKQGAPPPVQPRISVQANINELPPEERAFYYDKMGSPQLAQQVLQNNRQTTSQEKMTVDLAKAKINANGKKEKDEDPD
jgi:hypothetical protein